MLPIFAASLPISAALLWLALGMLSAVGFLALFSPTRFSALAGRCNQWVDTSHLLARLDRQVSVDQHVMPHSRLLGVAVLVAVVLIAGLYTWL